MDGLFTRIISRKKKKYYFVSLSGCMSTSIRLSLSLVLFFLQLSVFIYALFNLKNLQSFLFNDVDSSFKIKYLIFIIIVFIFGIGFVLLKKYYPKTVKYFSNLELPMAYIGLDIILYYLGNKFRLRIYQRILYFIERDESYHMYNCIKLSIKILMPSFNLFVFYAFIFDQISTKYLYVMIPINMVIWLLGLFLQTFEQSIKDDLKALKTILSVTATKYEPGANGLISIQEMMCSLTDEGIRLGYTENDVHRLSERWLVLASLKAKLERFKEIWGITPYVLFIGRFVLWLFISYWIIAS